MLRKLTVGFIATLLAALAGFQRAPSALAANEDQHWVTTWSTALLAPNTIVFGTNAGFTNQTLRQIVQTSIGGDRVRVRLSSFGASALHIGGSAYCRSGDGRVDRARHGSDVDVRRPAVRRDSAWRDRGE